MRAKNLLQNRSPRRHVELRTGLPYFTLVSHQTLFAEAVGAHFEISPRQIIPTAGTTGAIEVVRNHIFKTCAGRHPRLLTVTPGYWRASEAFQGLGFLLVNLRTQPNGFAVDEAEIVERARDIRPELIYLSLPNNPTGAIFEPEKIVSGVPEATAVMFDLTLPSRHLDTKELLRRVCTMFGGRRNLFLVGSTSKSHNTAEHRIGWAVCANAEDAEELRRENRNVVSTLSIAKGVEQLGKAPTALGNIGTSFSLLGAGERVGLFEIIRPRRMAETAYVLIRPYADVNSLKAVFEEGGIRVMWGSEFGLTDDYIRLETLEPANVQIFIETMASYSESRGAGAPRAVPSQLGAG